MNNNTLWEKHRIFIPQMRSKATHRCKHCKYFIKIQGKKEIRYGCVINIQIYKQQVKKVPPVIPIIEIIKEVGKEGLKQCVKNNNPDAQACGKFYPK